jgi:hypothetical protein
MKRWIMIKYQEGVSEVPLAHWPLKRPLHNHDSSQHFSRSRSSVHKYIQSVIFSEGPRYCSFFLVCNLPHTLNTATAQIPCATA